MKKFGYVLALLLEVILYAGAYIFNYFTKRKLGMSRYVVYLNGKIEKAMPVQTIIYIGLAAAVVLFTVSVIVYAKKHADLTGFPAVMLGASTFTTLFCAYYVLANSITEKRAYYILSLLFTLAGIIQGIKTLTGCFVCKKKN